jgi:UDP-N-acetyl-D-mannosaminuronate dehydrogenase
VPELHQQAHETVEWVAEADCVIMLPPHSQFLQDRHWQDARLIVDTRNVFPSDVANGWRP